MAIEKITIDRFLQLAADCPVIDVRSPGEYKHAHIPGAYSLPLFTDEERKVVGTTYKQQSREAAIKIGLDFFGPKMKGMVLAVEELIHSRIPKGIRNQELGIGDEHSNNSEPDFELPTTDYRLLLYCWRGGMRSAAIAWLLDLYGFKVYTLAGGYKSFRRQALAIFDKPYSFRLIGGFTGSGKTELLNALKEKGEKVIDLEAIARHKGSAFGSIGMPEQPSQEMFENLVALELKNMNCELSIVNSESEESAALGKFSKTAECADSPLTIHHSPIWLEDESQRIGQVNIPNGLWKTMRRSPVFFVDIPFDERLDHISSEYGTLDKQRMIDAITRIREKLGGLNAKMAIQYLEEENTIESFRILLKYYDKFYLKALHNREDIHSLLQRIECKSVTAENARLLIHANHLSAQEV
jgi:tRNA 2-selenouridine synthase